MVETYRQNKRKKKKRKERKNCEFVSSKKFLDYYSR